MAAPEYVEAPEDILAERIVRRWKQHADLSRAQALDIVKAEYVRFQIERESRDLDHYSYAKGISAVLAYIADSATPMVELDAVALDPKLVSDTLGVLLKYQDDIQKMQGSDIAKMLSEIGKG